MKTIQGLVILALLGTINVASAREEKPCKNAMRTARNPSKYSADLVSSRSSERRSGQSPNSGT